MCVCGILVQVLDFAKEVLTSVEELLRGGMFGEINFDALTGIIHG